MAALLERALAAGGHLGDDVAFVLEKNHPQPKPLHLRGVDMSRPSVYLAGPITGLTYDESTDWRDSVAAELDDVGITAYSPLRCKQYLREFGELDAAGGQDSAYVGVNPLSDPAGITARDRNDVKTKDAILINLLGAERISVGTCIEVGWADAFRKPIIVAMEEDNVHRHAILNHCAGFIAPTLEQAVEIVKAVLLP